jgi:glucosamine--fructose-6-phosphate aminotransferase (isomerizing)
MCGIVGYVGTEEAQPILFECLSRLEYRGYDSCGIAVGGSQLKSFKDSGRVATLKNAPSLRGTIGIGHTRWATHGPPNAINAHPHLDCFGKIAVVHNGIINNYFLLKQKLIREGHVFVSETDTEVIPHLIEKHYKGDLVKAVDKALSELEGSYAIAVLMEGQDSLVVSRKDSPLIIGVGDGENFIASDVPAILEYTNRIIYLEDGDIAILDRKNIFISHDGKLISRKEQVFEGNVKQIQKDGYPHFMLKEICEQPRIIRESLGNYPPTEYVVGTSSTLNSSLQDLLIVACGTSFHAGLLGKYIIEKLTGIPVRVELGSEFSHCDYTVLPSAAIAITQSGETADVLTSIKKLRSAGVRTTAITNCMGATANRIAQSTIYTKAGPELSVAATKSFIAQLMELYKIALSSDLINGTIARTLNLELHSLANKVESLLSNQEQIIDIARDLMSYSNAFFIGRGINYPIALEGALKLKEIAYIWSEGYAAGELKHGPFALLDKNTPVIAIVARDNFYNQMISCIKEVKSRESPVIAVIDEMDEVIEDLADRVIRVPHVGGLFTPIVNTVALQLLAYHTSRLKGCPIDFPRNLAKSVTVE